MRYERVKRGARKGVETGSKEGARKNRQYKKLIKMRVFTKAAVMVGVMVAFVGCSKNDGGNGKEEVSLKLGKKRVMQQVDNEGEMVFIPQLYLYLSEDGEMQTGKLTLNGVELQGEINRVELEAGAYETSYKNRYKSLGEVSGNYKFVATDRSGKEYELIFGMNIPETMAHKKIVVSEFVVVKEKKGELGVEEEKIVIEVEKDDQVDYYAYYISPIVDGEEVGWLRERVVVSEVGCINVEGGTKCRYKVPKKNIMGQMLHKYDVKVYPLAVKETGSVELFMIGEGKILRRAEGSELEPIE